MTKKVLVLKGDSYKAVGEMFARHGYDVLYDVSRRSEADVIVFTGGSDVSPYIYGEEPHGARGCDPIRDEFEKSLFNEYPTSKIKIGICRGGQLLNVLNGGKMIQDHGLISGDKSMVWDCGGEYLTLRVDHHQGMIARGDIFVDSWNEEVYSEDYSFPDYAIFYSETNSLCFQPHPEWGHQPTEDYFFELLERYDLV
jgi:hypothetical protein